MLSLHCLLILTFIPYLPLPSIQCELDVKCCAKRCFCPCAQYISSSRPLALEVVVGEKRGGSPTMLRRYRGSSASVSAATCDAVYDRYLADAQRAFASVHPYQLATATTHLHPGLEGTWGGGRGTLRRYLGRRAPPPVMPLTTAASPMSTPTSSLPQPRTST